MRLRHGVTAERAVTVLTDCITASQRPRAGQAMSADIKRHNYLNWVYETQLQIRSIWSDGELEDALLGRGYWHICAIPQADDRLMNRLVDEELIYQAGYPGIRGDPGGRLGEAVTRLRTLASLGNRDGRICVPDTNVFLHYTRFDQLPWAARMGLEDVRLIIPLAVVDELDAKKYARREEFQQRARELLTLIDGYVTRSPPDGYSHLQPGVTVEVLPDESDHVRAASNDQEILERCEFLHQATGRPATLITGDSGMRINAQARGIDVFKLSADDLLPRHKLPDSDIIAGQQRDASSRRSA
jgi:rRNA-processing protein FCF1